jgi:hypothetical protein
MNKHELSMTVDGKLYLCQVCGLEINRLNQRALEKFKTNPPPCSPREVRQLEGNHVAKSVNIT